MRSVLVLGGTAEARELAAALDGDPQTRVISTLAGRVVKPRLPAGEERDAVVMVAMTWPCYFHRRLLPLRGACFGVTNELWPDLLKQGFNCCDPGHTMVPGAHMVMIP